MQKERKKSYIYIYIEREREGGKAYEWKDNEKLRE